MEESKISVIVPVYKVEPYLRKCLDSVVNQTYQNLEIILVDDGSPDHCGAICEEYAARDKRIRVIHKENGGLSSARNAALEIATGDYIGFVDSDDWIEPEMFKFLLHGLETTGADIAVCGRYEEYRDRRVIFEWPEVRIMDRGEALGELLKNDQLQNLVWDKLYRRKLFEGICFPEGKTFEDMAVMHKLFLCSERVVCVPGTMYHYLQREGSIVGDISLKNRLNHYEMAETRYEELKVSWPQYAGLMAAQCVASAVGLWTIYLSNPLEEQKRYREKMGTIAAFARCHRGEALEYMRLGLAGRLVLRLVSYDTWWAFSLANGIGKLYKWRHGRAL